MLFQAQRSLPPSSSSSTAGSQAGSPQGPTDTMATLTAHDRTGPSCSILNKKEFRGLPKAEKREALTKPEDALAIKIEDIHVPCQNLFISTLFVGTHAVSRHIRSGSEKGKAQNPTNYQKDQANITSHHLPKVQNLAQKRTNALGQTDFNPIFSPNKLNTEPRSPKKSDKKLNDYIKSRMDGST